MRRRPTQENKAEYTSKFERNDYVRIRRKKEIEYENDIQWDLQIRTS